MRGNPSRNLLTVVGLGVAALLLGGCPKTPVVTSGTGAVTGKPPAPAAAAPTAKAAAKK